MYIHPMKMKAAPRETLSVLNRPVIFSKVAPLFPFAQSGRRILLQHPMTGCQEVIAFIPEHNFGALRSN